MAKFVVEYQDEKIGSLEAQLLEDHVAYLRKYSERGILFLCGPFKDREGAPLIFETDSLVEAENYVLEDPFIRDGYYGSYSIRQLREANFQNDFKV